MPRVEMYFKNRPSNEDIVRRLEEKVDPEVVYEDNDPCLAWYLELAQKYPLKPDQSTSLWGSSESAAFPIGSTRIHEIHVTENPLSKDSA